MFPHRGCRLLHPGRQEARGPDGGGEDRSAGQTLPRPEHKAADQNQGVQGVQGGARYNNNQLSDKKISIIPNFQSSVDKLMAKTNNSILAGSSSWLEQFTGAFEVQAGKKLLLMEWKI